jgi:hypothetical protein
VCNPWVNSCKFNPPIVRQLNMNRRSLNERRWKKRIRDLLSARYSENFVMDLKPRTAHGDETEQAELKCGALRPFFELEFGPELKFCPRVKGPPVCIPRPTPKPRLKLKFWLELKFHPNSSFRCIYIYMCVYICLIPIPSSVTPLEFHHQT